MSETLSETGTLIGKFFNKIFVNLVEGLGFIDYFLMNLYILYFPSFCMIIFLIIILIKYTF